VCPRQHLVDGLLTTRTLRAHEHRGAVGIFDHELIIDVTAAGVVVEQRRLDGT
jgi:hypothetical protein